MNTRYKIIAVTAISISGFLFIPFYATHTYCTLFESENGGCIRISGVGVGELTFYPPTLVFDDESNCDEICIDDKTYKPSIEQLQRVLNHCESQRKLASGETPERNADGSHNVITAIGLSYTNGTHFIDNNTCEWQKVK